MLRTCNCQKQTRPRLLAAASAATQTPPPVPLHVRGGDTALLTQSVANFKFEFLECGSRRVKFESKFEYKRIRRSIFVLDEALFKFGDGSYLVGNDRAKFKSNEV